MVFRKANDLPRYDLLLLYMRCKPLDALTGQGSAHTPVRGLGHFARSSAFGGERHPHGRQASGPGSKENEDNLLSTAGAAGLAGVMVHWRLLGGACVPQDMVVSPLGMVVMGAGEDAGRFGRWRHG